MVTLTKEWLLKERAHWQRAAKNTPIPQGFLLRVATCDLALQGLEESVRSEALELLDGWQKVLEVDTPSEGLCEGKFTLWHVHGTHRHVLCIAHNSYDDVALNTILGLLEATRRALQSPARVAEGGAMKYSPDEHDGKVPESPAEEQPGEVVAMVKRLREAADRLNKATEGYPTSVPTLGMLLNDAAALIEKLGQRVNQLERVLELYCPNHSLLSASDLDISPPPPERP